MKSSKLPALSKAVRSERWLCIGLWVTLVVSGILLPSGGAVALVLLHPKGMEWLIVIGLLYVVYDCGRAAAHHPWRRKTHNEALTDLERAPRT